MNNYIKLTWRLLQSEGKYVEVPLLLKKETILAIETTVDGKLLVVTSQISNGSHRAYLVLDKLSTIEKQLGKS